MGYWFALTLAVALPAAFFLAAARVIPHTIAGRRVSEAAWWRVSPLLLLAGALAGAIAYGFRAKKPWSRHLVLALWATIAVGALASGLSGDIPRDVMWRALAEPVALTFVCAWYFYGKPNVVKYFREISHPRAHPLEEKGR